MAIRVIATLAVPDLLSDGPRSAVDLAALVDADPDALDRLLRHLAENAVLERLPNGDYASNPTTDLLRRDHPSGLRDLYNISGAIGRADLAFVRLLDSVQNGEPSFPRLFGRSFWDDLAIDPERTASYDEQMGNDVAMWANELVDAYDWGSLGHIVDVGGGNGTLLAALLRHHPALTGTVFERPETANAARAVFERAGLEARSHVVAGSFFERLPSKAGGYLLCAVLHDWDDKDAVAILRRCKAAATADSRILIVEKTGAAGTPPSSEMDLRLLVYFGARERSLRDLGLLAMRAGLQPTGVVEVGSLSILDCVVDADGP